jgi:hypothetical protein
VLPRLSNDHQYPPKNNKRTKPMKKTYERCYVNLPREVIEVEFQINPSSTSFSPPFIRRKLPLSNCPRLKNYLLQQIHKGNDPVLDFALFPKDDVFTLVIQPDYFLMSESSRLSNLESNLENDSYYQSIERHMR